MIRAGGILRGLGFAALIGLAACETPPEPTPIPDTPPQQRPAPEPAAPPLEIAEPSEASKTLATYYRRLQNDLLTQGLLRGDGGGPDTPFTDTMLARNFIQIALFAENVTTGGVLRPRETESRLQRWDQPIRMAVEFGGSVPSDVQQQDRSTISAYASRLSRITGLSIIQTDVNPNYHVLVLSEDDKAASVDRIRQIVPGISADTLRAITTFPREQLCIVAAFSDDGSASYGRAIAIIRAEHPDLLRTTCFHEELAQGLGLANDSPAARPSIFNDDEEFGLLTTHDELLLKMLYDPRFRTGMTAAEATPIARQIARELVDGGES